MAERESAKEARVLRDTHIGEYTLLNSEKLGRALDLMEGLVEPANSEEAGVVAACKKLGEEAGTIALYDRFGGAIKLGERKLSTGTFYDFTARAPRKEVKINEEDYTDEYVLTKKKTRKGKKSEDAADRIKRLESKAKKGKSVEKEPEEAQGTEEGESEVEKEPAKKTRKGKK